MRANFSAEYFAFFTIFAQNPVACAELPHSCLPLDSSAFQPITPRFPSMQKRSPPHIFSSPAAFASTLEKHIASLTYGNLRSDNRPMDDRILRKAILRVDEDYANDQEVENAQSEAVEEASCRAQPLTIDQQQMLSELRKWAQIARNQVDSKAKAVLSWLDTNLKTNGHWNEHRVILFTEYRTTL
ncbi:hypothetical protein ACYCII_23940 [Enterobacter roggenkampii]|uniref:hypothetical protein n=1 Tax=Enterobacter roggenkampii TaxID=1812935 RepID=UPI003D6E8EA7